MTPPSADYATVYLPEARHAAATAKLPWSKGVFSVDRLETGEVVGMPSLQMAAKILDWWLSKHPIDAKIFLCMVHSEQPNAAALKLDEKVYCVAISDSLFDHILMFARHFLSIDTLGLVLGLPAQISRITCQNYQKIERDSRGFPKVVFHDEMERIAPSVAKISTAFVVLHEIGHIVEGHLSFNESGRGGTVPACDHISEVSNDAGKDEDSQALELDADEFAITYLMEAVREPFMDLKSVWDIDDWMYPNFALLGAHFFFLPLDFGQTYNAAWFNTLTTHPFRDFRMNYLYGKVSWMLCQAEEALSEQEAIQRTNMIGSAIMIAESQMEGSPLNRFRKNRGKYVQTFYGLSLKMRLEKLKPQLHPLRTSVNERGSSNGLSS